MLQDRGFIDGQYITGLITGPLIERTSDCEPCPIPPKTTASSMETISDRYNEATFRFVLHWNETKTPHTTKTLIDHVETVGLLHGFSIMLPSL